MTPCPCGARSDYAECCGRFLDGEAQAPTAEALMRSRYTAHVKADVDYLSETHDPKTRARFDPDGAEKWANESEWLGLEILATQAGGPDDERGTVEFVARYRADGEEREHRERSEFVRRDERWYFNEGRVLGPRPIRAEEPKVGRNEPCPCGSGRKYKKCCGRALGASHGLDAFRRSR